MRVSVAQFLLDGPQNLYFLLCIIMTRRTRPGNAVGMSSTETLRVIILRAGGSRVSVCVSKAKQLAPRNVIIWQSAAKRMIAHDAERAAKQIRLQQN